VLKTVQKERIKLILGYNHNLHVHFRASLQIPCIPWVIQLILLAHPSPRAPLLELWDLGEMLGEVRTALRTGVSGGSWLIRVLSRLRIHPGVHPLETPVPWQIKPAAKC